MADSMTTPGNAKAFQAEAAFDDGSNQSLKTALWSALGVVLLAAAIWFLYTQITSTTGVLVEDEQPRTQVDLIPPPPPPPPPPPQEQQPDTPPEPSEVPDAAPEAPAPDTPQQMTIAGDPAPGATGGLAAGTGSGIGTPGSTGTCLKPPCGTGAVAAPRPVFNDGLYRRYLGTELQRRVQRNESLARDNYSAIFNVTVVGGQVTRAVLVKSSGDGARDDLIREALLAATGLSAPPAEMRFPQRVEVRSRRG